MSISTAHCPRCGQANQCAQAASTTPVQHCWCFDARIDPESLASLSVEARNRTCLCPGCAQALPAADTDGAAR